MITTVTGVIDESSLDGPVLPHEHLILDLRTESDPDAILNDRDLAVQELAGLRQQFGLGLLVDQTCRGMGRDPESLLEISEASGVKVVASTGWYYERFHPESEPPLDLSQATEMLVRDVDEGIEIAGDGRRTHVRAGVIGEVGTHAERPTPGELVSLRAAARASLQTRTPVATHAHLGTGALAQVEVLLSEGVAPESILIGHQDLTEDARQHRQLLEAGVYLGFDTVGKESYQPDAVRVRMLVDLINEGFVNQLLLSNDVSRFGYLKTYGGGGYGHLFDVFLPQLLDEGLGENVVQQLVHNNPLRWLAGKTRDGVGA